METNNIQTGNSQTDEIFLKKKHLNYLSTRRDGRTVKMEILFGDLNSDGVKDAFIDWCIEANDADRNVGGGNALMSLACIEEGFSVYINTGNNYVLSAENGKDKFTEGEPNCTVDSIENGKIICSILSYTDSDPRCCPSMKKTFYLVLKNNILVKENI
jgi:hypothetical protein